MPPAKKPVVCVRKAGEPVDVMYGWCHKCREKFNDQYQALSGLHCTYCGGTLEDNYPALAMAVAILLFPVGIICCCHMKEKQCVICNRSFS